MKRSDSHLYSSIQSRKFIHTQPITAVAIAFSLTLGIAVDVNAQTWLGGADFSWNTDLNWDTGVVPNTPGTVAIIDNDDPSLSNQTITFTEPVTIGSLNIARSTGDFTLGTASDSILFDNSGSDSVVTLSGSSNATVASNITLSNYLVLDVSGSGVLTLGGNLTGNNNGIVKTGSGKAVLNGGGSLGSGGLDGLGGELGIGGNLTLVHLYVYDSSSGTATVTVENNASLQITEAILVGGDLAGSTGNGSFTANAASIVADSVYIGAGGASHMTINGGSLTTNPIQVGYLSNGTLTVTDGTVISSSIALGTEFGVTGTVNLSGGQIETAELIVGGNGEGIINVSGTGKLTATDYLYIGLYNGSTSTLNVSGGQIEIDSLIIGGAGNGVMTISGTGNVTTMSDVTIGFNLGSISTVTARGSSLFSVGGNLFMGGAGGSSTLTIENNATVSVSGDLSMAFDSMDDTTISLNGGTLEINGIARGLGTARINFNGGTLKAKHDNDFFLARFQPGTLTIQSGGAYIDSNGFTIGTDSNTQFSGSGSFNKLGDGTLILNTANSYSGATNIFQGTLRVTHAAALGIGGTLSIASGTTLDVALASAFDLNRSITGSGTLQINLADSNNEASFTGAGNQFAGLIALNNSTFNLSQGSDNATAVTNATLQLGSGNITKLSGTVSSAGLTLLGGTTLSFDMSGGLFETSILHLDTTSGNIIINFSFPQTFGIMATDPVYTLITFNSANDQNSSLLDANNYFTAGVGALDGYQFAWDGNSLVYMTVPEPSSYAAFLGLSVLALTVTSRRKRQSR